MRRMVPFVVAALGLGTAGAATFNFTAGEPTGGLVIVPVRPDGTIELAASSPTGVIWDTSGYFATPP